ncbi:MAG: hypothetical protein AVDCRST_MAG61-90, partial [uncultured Friedmanniella sp.]
ERGRRAGAGGQARPDHGGRQGHRGRAEPCLRRSGGLARAERAGRDRAVGTGGPAGCGVRRRGHGGCCGPVRSRGARAPGPCSADGLRRPGRAGKQRGHLPPRAFRRPHRR